ncbi:MAG: class I tRNA ligase family protein [Zavarzinella sp.]
MEKKGEGFVLKGQPDLRIDARAFKMSKSRGNVVSPDTVVSEYGADSLRLYEMFMGPLEAIKPWNMRSVEGVYRFLARVWRLIVDERAETPILHPHVEESEPAEETARMLHRTIKKVSEDTAGMRFNTAIAAMMEFTNHLNGLPTQSKTVLEQLVLLLSPYAPHVAEELWQVLGHDTTLAYIPWPTWDEALLVESQMEMPVQINGKVRARIMVPADADEQVLEAAALADPKVQEQIVGKTVRKWIIKPKQMINIIVG